MGDGKSKAPKKLSFKKQVNLEIIETLTMSLPRLKELLGEKKFEGRIEKAAKLLSAGVKEKKEKPKPVAKKKKPAGDKQIIDNAEPQT